MHEPIAYALQGGGKTSQNSQGSTVKKECSFTLNRTDAHGVAFAENSRAELRIEGGDGSRTGTLSSGGGKPGQGVPCAQIGLAVRLLTPRECERLQGFPDDWTLIPWRKAAAENCPDGPRYKALGNSMAVPVMRWIGERIATVDQIT